MVVNEPEQRCLEIAKGQYGLITRSQALAAGMTTYVINRKIELGRWEVLHRGVYRIAGLPDSWHTRLMAACLAGGPGAAASHRSAGELWQLDAIPAGLIEITTPRRIERAPLLAHRSALGEWELSRRAGIPVTDPTRTLLDLAAVINKKDLERAYECALRRRLTHPELLAERLERWARSGRTGVTAWRHLLQKRDPSLKPTESDFETLLNQMLERFGLPQPVRQLEIRDEKGRFLKRADFAFPDARLVIEADSVEHHMTPEEFQRDRTQTRELVTAGWTVLRTTHLELADKPEVLADSIRRILWRLSGN